MLGSHDGCIHIKLWMMIACSTLLWPAGHAADAASAAASPGNKGVGVKVDAGSVTHRHCIWVRCEGDGSARRFWCPAMVCSMVRAGCWLLCSYKEGRPVFTLLQV